MSETARVTERERVTKGGRVTDGGVTQAVRVIVDTLVTVRAGATGHARARRDRAGPAGRARGRVPGGQRR